MCGSRRTPVPLHSDRCRSGHRDRDARGAVTRRRRQGHVVRVEVQVDGFVCPEPARLTVVVVVGGPNAGTVLRPGTTVKLAALVAVAPDVVTVILPVLAPTGTFALTCVAETTVTAVALTP
jgi:hypothetical protein